jgi:hypothetical protein
LKPIPDRVEDLGSHAVPLSVEALERTLKRRERQAENSQKFWMDAAERALAAIHGASNSSHPAYSLWLRVEMAKQPPMDVVLSVTTEPQDPPPQDVAL